MHILIIGTLYEPDLGPSAPLFTLLAENLVRRGHQVTVITMVPHYPSGQVSSAFRGKWVWRTNENGVSVIRVGFPSVDRSNLTKRSIQYLFYQVIATITGLAQNYEVVLAANPFLTVWLPFAWLAVIKNKPSVYSVQDVYPDVGITLGVFHRKSIIKAARWLESYCLRHSYEVQIISDSFRPGLRALGVPDKKMTLIYNWVDTGMIRVLPKDNAFAQKFHLVDHFVVLYAGNIGMSQGLENVLVAAEQLTAYKDLKFVFVGDGKGKDLLEEQCQQQNIKNIQFIPFQPRQYLAEVLASADIELIMLKKGIGIQSLPSKTFSAMASGRPIIASLDENSETWRLINRAGAGLCVPPENPSALAKAILSLKQDQHMCEEFGRNGRLFVEKNNSPQSAAEAFEKLLLNAFNQFTCQGNCDDHF
jgi:colanic acid biosynthesis glycosyl transferase WcaI